MRCYREPDRLDTLASLRREWTRSANARQDRAAYPLFSVQSLRSGSNLALMRRLRRPAHPPPLPDCRSIYARGEASPV
jgi:hypothetical protein